MEKTVWQRKERLLAEESKYFIMARAFAYDLLKCIFAQAPSRYFLNFIIEGQMFQAFPFRKIDADVRQTLDNMLGFLESADMSSEKVLQKLCWDYTRLFIGPDEGQAPPWESMYRGGERLYFSKHSLAVRHAYQKYNLVSRRVGHEPDDHIALELDFMHTLCEKTKLKLDGGGQEGLVEIFKDQKRFLDDHLLRWVPVWTEDVIKNAEAGFYGAGVGLLNAYLKLDSQLLDAFITSPG